MLASTMAFASRQVCLRRAACPLSAWSGGRGEEGVVYLLFVTHPVGKDRDGRAVHDRKLRSNRRSTPIPEEHPQELGVQGGHRVDRLQRNGHRPKVACSRRVRLGKGRVAPGLRMGRQLGRLRRGPPLRASCAQSSVDFGSQALSSSGSIDLRDRTN